MLQMMSSYIKIIIFINIHYTNRTIICCFFLLNMLQKEFTITNCDQIHFSAAYDELRNVDNKNQFCK